MRQALGVINNLERRYRETSSNHIKDEIEEYMSKNLALIVMGKA